MHVPPLKCLSILPGLLHQLCLLSSSLGPLAPSMRVCLSFTFFCMLLQRNMTPPTPALFDPSRYTCRGNIIQVPPGLLIVVHWIKTHQSITLAPVLPIPEVLGHPADPVDSFHQLMSSSPSSKPNHPILTYVSDGHIITVTLPMLASALSIMLEALVLYPAIYSLHSLCSEGVMAAYRKRPGPSIHKETQSLDQ